MVVLLVDVGSLSRVDERSLGGATPSSWVASSISASTSGSGSVERFGAGGEDIMFVMCFNGWICLSLEELGPEVRP